MRVKGGARAATLTTIAIENFVLIERAQLDLSSGLTGISGMTGAGKSLVVRALMFLLGQRLPLAELRGVGPGPSRVEAHWQIHGDRLRDDLRTLGVNDEWGGEELIVSRSVDVKGRSRVRIGGYLATLATLRQVGARLVSLVSQHGYQALNSSREQTAALDGFGGFEDLTRRVDAGRRCFLDLRSRRDRVAQDRAERRQADVRLEEDRCLLDSLGPLAGEYEELEAVELRLQRAEELRRSLGHWLQELGEADDSLTSRVGKAQRGLEGLASQGLTLDLALRPLEDASSGLNECVREVARALDGVELDAVRLHTVEERLLAFRRLGRRLGMEPSELASEWDRVGDALDRVDDGELDGLEAELGARRDELGALDAELTRCRREAAQQLQAGVTVSLVGLGMAAAVFEVALSVAELPTPPAGGSARVEFMLAANPGVGAGPLGKVASGGELSRVMLALQRHLAEAIDVGFLLFDEVDQNVGGRLGGVIGAELKALAERHQVCVISHLPQVAAVAERHLLVAKATLEGVTRTTIRELEGEDRVQEIAAMTRGQEVTSVALAEARELLGEGLAAQVSRGPSRRARRPRKGKKEAGSVGAGSA